MNNSLSCHGIDITDFRKAPARAFKQAGENPVVVLKHNRPAGYILSNRLMARILDHLADRAVGDKALGRLAMIKSAKKISHDEL